MDHQYRRYGGAAAILLTSLALGTTADAATIFSENFSSLNGTPASTELTERRAGTLLTNISLPGWTLEGDTSQIFGHDASSDKAIWLNEVGTDPQAISRTITGLTPGMAHTLTFEVWGDNVDGIYGFGYEINGTTISLPAVIPMGLGSGSFGFIFQPFVPLGTSTTLRLFELSSGSASPLFDNVTITTAVAAIPEPSTYALMLAGLGLVIVIARRKRA